MPPEFICLRDVESLIGKIVNICGVITEIGISRKSRGTDVFCSLKIVDGPDPNSEIFVNVFAQHFENLPLVKSTGDIIQLFKVRVESYPLGINVVCFKNSQFALYKGIDCADFEPYNLSVLSFRTKPPNTQLISHLRNLIITKQIASASSGQVFLKDIKPGDGLNLTCKVLYICEVDSNEWILYVWDGTDAPVAKIEDELENPDPLPLQLEHNTLPRNLLCTFPTVGTVLRIVIEKNIGKLDLRLLKVGRWVQFNNISFDVYCGLWRGHISTKSMFSYLPDDNSHVLECLRTYNARLKHQRHRMPMSCHDCSLHLTATKCKEHVPFRTLMDILCYSKVTARFRCVVRVLETLPSHLSNFVNTGDHYVLQLTLEDPTARLYAFLYEEHAEKFFGGRHSIDRMIVIQNMLLGVEETTSSSRNPPYLECCIDSYWTDENDKWGSRTYRISDTTFLPPPPDV